MSRIIFTVFALFLGVASAGAQTPPVTPPCRSDQILNTGGLAIALQSGQRFKAYPGSEGKMSLWLPLDKLSVCDIGGSSVRIINLSRKNQSVKAARVFSQ